MTTPPQGPWGPGRPDDQPGGWTQPGQGQQSGGGWTQPPPEQGQPGGWTQPGGQGQSQGQWGQQQQSPWGQQGGQQQGGQQQPGGWQQQGGQGGWQQQGGGWQQGGQGGWDQQPPQNWDPNPEQPGGGNNKLPLFIGGGVAAAVVLGLVIFFGVRALGGDDPKTADPTPGPTSGQPTSGQPTNGEPTETGGPGQNEKLGNATGQAKAATDALNAAGFSCTDLFNNPQGAHRGCFKYDASTEAEVIFQFAADGSVIGQRTYVTDSDNLNNAQKTFNDALKGIGGAVFGDDVPNIESAVRSGKKQAEVATGWGVIKLENDGGRLRMSGRKAGGELLQVPKRMFDTKQADLFKGLAAKRYKCTTSCSKRGPGVSVYVYGYASDSEPLSNLTLSSSGEPAKVKPVFTTALGEVFGVVKGPDAQALLGWTKAHLDGKSHSSYVNGWRVTLRDRPDDSYGSMDLKIDYELFYV